MMDAARATRTRRAWWIATGCASRSPPRKNYEDPDKYNQLKFLVVGALVLYVVVIIVLHYNTKTDDEQKGKYELFRTCFLVIPV